MPRERPHGAAPWRTPSHSSRWLAASCRGMQPTERIGPVYFVYRLDEGALGRALGRDDARVSREGRPGRRRQRYRHVVPHRNIVSKRLLRSV